jgi:tetratricopeptide (TPR) repeat protein
LNGLGRVLGPQGLISESREVLEKALVVNPNYADAHFHLANVLLMQHEWSRALFHARRGIELCTDDDEARKQNFKALFKRAEQQVLNS